MMLRLRRLGHPDVCLLSSASSCQRRCVVLDSSPLGEETAHGRFCCVGELERAGIPYTPAVGAIFMWVDLRVALPKPAWEVILLSANQILHIMTGPVTLCSVCGLIMQG